MAQRYMARNGNSFIPDLPTVDSCYYKEAYQEREKVFDKLKKEGMFFRVESRPTGGYVIIDESSMKKKFVYKKAMFFKCHIYDNWYPVDESYICPFCEKTHVEVIDADECFCPKCGREALDYEETYLITRSETRSAPHIAMQYGGDPYDWDETWICPTCLTVFTYENANY